MVEGSLAAVALRPLALTLILALPAACGGHASDKGEPDGGTANDAINGVDDADGQGMGASRATGGSGTGGAAGGGLGGRQGLQTGNLIRNGDAEAAPGSTDGKPVATPDWTSTGQATAIQYDSGLEYPSVNDPVPPDHGRNLFSGGPDDATSSLSQTIDVSAYAAAIDAGSVQATLSGYFGGYSVQDDNAALTATFLTAGGQTLGSPVLVGGIVSADRSSQTGLWPKSQQAPVPAQTRSIEVVLTMTRVTGTIDDGYADDLSLMLTGP